MPHVRPSDLLPSAEHGVVVARIGSSVLFAAYGAARALWFWIIPGETRREIGPPDFWWCRDELLPAGVPSLSDAQVLTLLRAGHQTQAQRLQRARTGQSLLDLDDREALSKGAGRAA